LRTTVRTWSDAVSNASFTSGATRSTVGTCTANCSALPATDPHASRIASCGSDAREPKTISVAIIAAFHITGAA
jgi:hypothetical protein